MSPLPVRPTQAPTIRPATHRFYQNRGYRATGLRFAKSLAAGGGSHQMDNSGLSAFRTSGAPARTRH
jgi:hypothetical protein